MIAAVFEILTVGAPFCAFKIIAGLGLGQVWLTVWGIVDSVLNTMNLLSLLARGRRLTDVCLLSLAVRLVKKPGQDERSYWQDLGNAIDVGFSFAIVAFMLGGGFLPKLDALLLRIWNTSVILNVLGAGSFRLSASIKSLRHH
ncbi:MAG: hypothetical protein JNJ69_18455 [Leptospiraceae bacterium]|nr:hypothetical protein [Leptospiraceae bacterium]